MKTKALLQKLNSLIGPADQPDKAQLKQLRKVLKSLKKRQKALKEELDSAEGEHERRKLQQKIEVIQLQREKRVAVYRQFKQARES